MSVIVRKRKPSVIQYIETARKLVTHTIKYCRNFPKSAMFLITKDIVDNARQVYTNVLIANSIFPTTKQDIELRYEYLVTARGHINALDGLLGIAQDMWNLSISEYGWTHWGELMLEEITLINFVIKSDEKRGLEL